MKDSHKEKEDYGYTYRYTDISGIVLKPGNCGRNCPGNGEHFDENGNKIECCCDECNFLMLCLDGSS